MATPAQIRIIHALKGALWMDDEAYAAFLSGWGVVSSKDLSTSDANKAVDALRKRAVEARVFGVRRARAKRRTRADAATHAQQAKIRRLWYGVCRAPAASRDTALDEFLARRFGVARLEWLTHDHVGKVIYTLEAMSRQKHEEVEDAGNGAH